MEGTLIKILWHLRISKMHINTTDGSISKYRASRTTPTQTTSLLVHKRVPPGGAKSQGILFQQPRLQSTPAPQAASRTGLGRRREEKQPITSSSTMAR